MNFIDHFENSPIALLAVGFRRFWKRLRARFWSDDAGDAVKSAVADAARGISDAAALKSTGAIPGYVQGLVGSLPVMPHTQRRSVVITGYARSGKTLLADRLERKYGFAHIELDSLKKAYYSIGDDRTRKSIREGLLHGLLSRFPSGVVLEGDDLISLNRGENGGMLPFSLLLLRQLQEEHQVKCYVVGNAKATVQHKEAGLRRFRDSGKCWTEKKPSWRDLESRARKHINHSRELLALADACNLRFLELDPARFHESLERAAIEIARDTEAYGGLAAQGGARK